MNTRALLDHLKFIKEVAAKQEKRLRSDGGEKISHAPAAMLYKPERKPAPKPAVNLVNSSSPSLNSSTLQGNGLTTFSKPKPAPAHLDKRNCSIS